MQNLSWRLSWRPCENWRQYCFLLPGVKIYFDCVIGRNVTIHAGTVIGGDGFGFAHRPMALTKKIPQIGNVVVEDYVEIGSNACIDRATIGSKS